MFDRCDETAKVCLFRSRLIAAAVGAPAIEPEHLIFGILEAAPKLIDSVGGRPNTGGNSRPRTETAIYTVWAGA